MYMTLSVRFFGVYGPKSLPVAVRSFQYLRELDLEKKFDLWAMPIGAATFTHREDPQLGHWLDLQHLFGKEPPTVKHVNIVCASLGWQAGRTISRPRTDPTGRPLPKREGSDGPAYVAQGVYDTYWTTGFRNIAIVCEAASNTLPDASNADEVAALSKYKMIIAPTAALTDALKSLGADAFYGEPRTFARALDFFGP